MPYKWYYICDFGGLIDVWTVLTRKAVNSFYMSLKVSMFMKVELSFLPSK